MTFESVLMTFHEKSDEQIAYEALTEANEELKMITKGSPCSENQLRALMEKFLDAFWVYKVYDVSIAMDIATNIHSIGSILATQYGCHLEYDGEKKSYYTCCPAHLLHMDFGFSIRAIEKQKCSICGKDVLDCDHLSGDYYDDVECWTENGHCNICWKKECKEHIVGKRYNRVMAGSISYDTKLITFDMVHNPEMRYARVKKLCYSEDEMLGLLPEDEREEFISGRPKIHCTHCLSCGGYNPEIFDSFFQNVDEKRRKDAAG